MNWTDRIFRYYIIWVKCNNCKEIYDLSVPRGYLVNEYLLDAKCKYCGCNSLELK